MNLNLFQLITLPILALLTLGSIVRLARGGHRRDVTLLSILIWLAAAAAIIRPSVTADIAHALGIGRGADLVFYLVAIAFLASVFYFYHQVVVLRSEVTALVRILALQEAEKDLPQRGAAAVFPPNQTGAQQ